MCMRVIGECMRTKKHTEIPQTYVLTHTYAHSLTRVECVRGDQVLVLAAGATVLRVECVSDAHQREHADLRRQVLVDHGRGLLCVYM